ncbi:ABC transporter permease [Lutimaribacter marinistellae]|uniref:ABC transporter permease n=1 Tax=Lutimaribacter marinistellae TaxID=1820329 RepID=A0ABV7TGP9_9RHOB
MAAAELTVEETPDGPVLRCAGRLLTRSLDAVEQSFAEARLKGGTVRLDLSGMEAMDTGGAWLIADLIRRLEAEGTKVQMEGASQPHAALLETVMESLPEAPPEEARTEGFRGWVERIGESMAASGKDSLSILSFLGETLAKLGGSLIRPWRVRWPALVSQMQIVGFSAVPIVALMGFLIGIVLAFQGATQLRQFGAEVFVVDLIAISILRELGVLLTAIIVAGRSGSAFTASLGAMKVQEEIDAMRTLSLDPIEVLVLPRVLALVIMLPILGFIANISGLIGGALMSWIDLGVSPGMFTTRLQDVDIWHLAIGMIKAPFFAVLIGIVACWQAFQVGGSSESVGRRTTASVVQSIFAVIVIDALFSIFFAKMGV